MNSRNKLLISILFCGLGLYLPVAAPRSEGICPAGEQAVVMHCGDATVIRCGAGDNTCPARIIVVPKVVTKVVKVPVKPKHHRAHGPLDFLLHH